MRATMSRSDSNPLATAAFTMAALVAFAANSLLCRAALRPGLVDPASFTTIRIASGALTLFVLTKWVASRAAAGARGSFTSAFALFAYAIAFSLAYVRIGAGIGALVLFGTVQVTMVGWGLFAGERPRAGEWGGLGLAVLGLAVFMLPGTHAPDSMGTALMIAAGIAWGVYSLRGRKSSAPLLATADNFARATPFAIGASTVAVASTHVTARGALLAAISGSLASGLGYCLWYLALPRLTATRAALVQLLVPLLAALGAVALLGEAITSRLLGGGSIVVVGVALAIAAKRR
jgi:drug/metabolite transporter (DMT)-like permease